MRLWRGYFRSLVNINTHTFVNINIHRFVDFLQETKYVRIWRGYFKGQVNINVLKFVNFFQETKVYEDLEKLLQKV